ncbi:MAG: hypothetical protein ACRD1X_07965 [Vicinamibacteria bacterium]
MPPSPDAETAVIVPPETVFPGLRADEGTLVDLLRGVSRTDTLFWCARANLTVAGSGNETPTERQQRVLNALCTPDEIRRINAFAEGHGGVNRVRAFFRGQLLELMRWVSEHSADEPRDGETFNDPEVRRRFVQAALIAAVLWSERVFGDRFKLDGGIEVARRRGLAPIRKSIEESGTAPELQNSLGRGWVLFSEHLPRRYPGLGEEFLAATGLSLEEYFVCVAALTVQYLGPAAATPIMNWRTTASATAYREIFPEYIELESHTVSELASAFTLGEAGYRELRERPILRTEDDRAIILDPVFFSERASVGRLFHLIGSRNPHANANRIFSAFGLAFEDYVAAILSRMYPTGDALVSRLALNVSGRDGSGTPIEIDAVLNDATEIVVFETKAAWLREDRLRDDTYEGYLEHLREKYGVRVGRSHGERVKGVGQLARSSGAIANGDWLGSQDEFRVAEVIYPVLIVHDALLGAPVYGNFLAGELNELLQSRMCQGDTPRRRVTVAPLTVMTIADLEALEESVNHFALRDLLRDYTRECPDRLRSLHNFIAFSRYGGTMYQSAYLTRKTGKLLKRTQEALFPGG